MISEQLTMNNEQWELGPCRHREAAKPPWRTSNFLPPPAAAVAPGKTPGVGIWTSGLSMDVNPEGIPLS